jgi:hypothetical protein
MRLGRDHTQGSLSSICVRRVAEVLRPSLPTGRKLHSPSVEGVGLGHVSRRGNLAPAQAGLAHLACALAKGRAYQTLNRDERPHLIKELIAAWLGKHLEGTRRVL